MRASDALDWDAFDDWRDISEAAEVPLGELGEVAGEVPADLDGPSDDGVSSVGYLHSPLIGPWMSVA